MIEYKHIKRKGGTPVKPIVTRYKIKSEKLSPGLRIALVSDLHQRDADDIALLIEKIEPDSPAFAFLL